ncbi:nitrous oxide-stimulated promoter family protein [Ferrimonas lipolytica]|uniref:Nitrous oxide-stimulated promoter family protein n=1 Tax=Ferrimonas lipolytica TaxID=2724191 RepID=A0A6H1UCA1_9GAMM|nr:nitrous oxide-stimulated promoter family protein [Ferrimonas lipolytica]QIZ76727.1 nitrous oxide-stimulated promoter family protein [Ferrimonas lipolytica]
MSSELLTGRLAKEHKTITHMLQIYCRHHHQHQLPLNGLCDQCLELADYAAQKLDRCPYGDTKPDCARCPIHCYKPEQRQQARVAMRFAGPKMLWHHPIEALQHLIDKKRAIPARPPQGKSQYALRKAANNNSSSN